MILDLDAGNSRIKWRLRESLSKEGAKTGALASIEQLRELKLEQQLTLQVRVASVRGESWDGELVAWLRENWGLAPKLATVSKSCAGVTNNYQDYSKLGVDRWLAMLAGYGRAHNACVVVDCGTALTVDVLEDDGNHRGGYIVPGLTTMRDSLFLNTRIPRFGGGWPVTTELGGGTMAAINNGILASLVGLISMTFNTLQQETLRQAKLYLTGGDADTFSALLEVQIEALEVVPDLVLDGLDLMFSG